MPEIGKLGTTKKQGVKYVFSDGTSFDAPEITAEIISNARYNHLLSKLYRNQEQLIFTKPFTISVKAGRDDEVDDALTEKLLGELSNIDLWILSKRIFGDVFWFGPGIVNGIFEYEGTSYVIKDFRRLPAESFSGEGSGDFILSSLILPGIGLNREKEVEYWQTQEDGLTEQLDSKSIMMFTDPLAPGIAGTPICLPLISLISFYKFLINALAQKNNREGIGKVYPKFTGPAKDASVKNGNVSDEDYINLVMSEDDKDHSYALRENMDYANPYLSDSSIILDSLEFIEKRMMSYFSPADMIAKDGTLIGGSSASELGLVLRYISGWHETIEGWIQQLLTPWLIGNGYKDYYIDVDIPEPEIDTSELDLKRAEVAIKTSGIVKANDFLRLIGLPEDEKLKDVYIEKEKVEVATFQEEGCCKDLEELCLKFEN